MIEKNYKIVIGVLLATNSICLITIFILCGEIYLLQDQLSKMTDMIQMLNDKASKIELVQEKTFLDKGNVEMNNKYLMSGAFVLIVVLFLMCLGAGSTGGEVLDQSALDFEGHGAQIIEKLINITSSSRNILSEVASNTDRVCNKLDAILKEIIKIK